MQKNQQLTDAIVDIFPPTVDIFPPTVDIFPPTVDIFRRHILYKASGTIASEGKLSLVERRTYNCLLANAREDMRTQEIHTISATALMGAMEYKITSYEEIRNILRSLVSTIIEWNILGKDGREWTASTYLAEATLVEETLDIRYAFAPNAGTTDQPTLRAFITAQAKFIRLQTLAYAVRIAYRLL